MLYEVIVIGAGPAGITAAVYAARKRMELLVITKDVGGQTALTSDIENYTGYQFITGAELTSRFEEHIKKYGIRLKEEEVKELEEGNDRIIVKTEKNTYEAKTCIVATGARWKELSVPGEREFKNRGLSYCVTCDGPLFAGKDVAVIGGGNSGLQAAIQLDKIANRIYLIERGASITGDAIVREKVIASNKIIVMTKTTVKAIFGERVVKGIKVLQEKNEKTLKIQGVFVEIGLVPNSTFRSRLNKNEKGEIKINSLNETNIPRIFAAGDVTDVAEKQIIVAAGEGAKAALAAFRYLTHHR